MIILPITSGDTALRSLRLMLADSLHLDQKSKRNRVLLALGIFVLVAALLLFAKLNANGFNVLWQYFAWSNQTIAVFALAMITVYCIAHGKNYWIAILPGTFYCFIVMSYILNATIGFNVPYAWACSIAGILALGYAILVIQWGKKKKRRDGGVLA